jgi:ribosome-interacting GTPase 1
VVLIGPPNTGKSSLLVATTNAEARVAEYPFTNTVPQPGMWHRDDVQIELVDTPPIAPERMPVGLAGTIRSADLVCVVAEGKEAGLEEVESVLEMLEARGLTLRTLRRDALDVGESGLRPGLILVNKCELASAQDLDALRELYADQLEVLPVSARTGEGLDALFHRLRELLAIIRIYAKQPGRPPDMHKPFTLRAGSTVEDLARAIHRDLPGVMKFARLWGHGRFEGQQVHKTEVLQDRDIVEIHE